MEIDLVANDGDEYMFCECKWRNEKLDLPVLKSLIYIKPMFSGKTAAEHGLCFFQRVGLPML